MRNRGRTEAREAADHQRRSVTSPKSSATQGAGANAPLANHPSPEALRRELVAAQEELQQTLRAADARVMSCRSRSHGIAEQIAATRALVRLIRDDADLD
jgi:hypothetical protein